VTAARARTWLLRAWVTLVFAFLMLPVVVIVLASLSRTSYLTVPPRGLTLSWFTKVLSDPEYVHAIVWSVLLALVATAGSLGAGIAASFALIRRRVTGGAGVAALLVGMLRGTGDTILARGTGSLTDTAPLIVDTRNATAKLAKGKGRIVSLASVTSYATA